MSKFKEYRNLTKDVRQKRDKMCAAQVKITNYQKEYFVDEPGSCHVAACINKFEHVYGISSDPNTYYDKHGVFTKNCVLFGPESCPDRKCPMYAANLDYIVARERYDAAVAKRRQFIKDLFKKKSK